MNESSDYAPPIGEFQPADIEEDDFYRPSDNMADTPLWKSAPENIWLACGDEEEDWLHELSDCVDVTWAADFCPVAVGVGYVRGDIHEAMKIELERLRAAQPAVPDAMTMPTGSHDALVQSFVNGWNACRNQMLAASQRKEGA